MAAWAIWGCTSEADSKCSYYNV